MNRLFTASLTVVVVLIGFVQSPSLFGGGDWMKQIETVLKEQIQQNLLAKYVRYDTNRNIVAVSPALMELAVDKARQSFGGNLRTFVLKPVGNMLNFSLTLKDGAQLSADVELEALEVSMNELTIIGRLPQGLQIGGLDLRKTLYGFFDTLIGSSPAASSSAAVPPLPVLPSPSSSSSSHSSAGINEFLKTFSVEGNTFRLRRPLNASILGRSLASAKPEAAGLLTPASPVQRMALKMENGWMNLYLGDFNLQRLLLQVALENLGRQAQGW
jgi:hypothetical protein